MDNKTETPEKTPVEQFRGFAEKIKALPDEVQADLRKIVARAEATGKTVDETQGEMADHVDGLPENMSNHVKQQLRNGIVDIKGLLPEQLRGLANDAAIDGEVASLAFAMRGDPTASMNNWKAIVSDTPDAALVEVTSGVDVKPQQTPKVPDEELTGKKGQPTVGV